MADDLDNIIAIASGIPPDWVEDIPATEAWALMQAAMYAEPGSTFMVDCKPCVDAVHKGSKAARSEKNPHARIHTLLHQFLEEVPPASVVWMPSHCKKGQAGEITRGDGFLLTERDIELNDLADTYAKRAVDEHRVPMRKRNEIKAHDEATKLNAMWIARATLLANEQLQAPHRDTQASREKALEAARRRKRHRAEQAATPLSPQAVDPTTGLAVTVKARPRQQGGHDLPKVAGGWWCTVCRTASAKWSKLAPQQCNGHATDRWSDMAKRRGRAERNL